VLESQLHLIFASTIIIVFCFIFSSYYAGQYGQQLGSKVGERWGNRIRKDHEPELKLCCPKHSQAICWSCCFDFF